MTAPARDPRAHTRAPSHRKPPLPPMADLRDEILSEGIEAVSARYDRLPSTLRSVLTNAGHRLRSARVEEVVLPTFDPMPWAEEAACAGVDPEVWFPKPRDRRAIERAKTICRSCPVQTQCLTDALTRERGGGDTARWGIWGAHTPDERQRLDRQGAA